MKNRKLTYFLIVAVLLVWGFALYQIVGALWKGEEESFLQTDDVREGTFHSHDEHFAIKANYRDPFLGKVTLANHSGLSKMSPVKTVKQAVVQQKLRLPQFDMSFVTYIGKIKNQKTGKEVALVSIHGNQYFLSDGAMVDSVTLVKSYKDSIEVRFRKNRFFIRK